MLALKIHFHKFIFRD